MIMRIFKPSAVKSCAVNSRMGMAGKIRFCIVVLGFFLLCLYEPSPTVAQTGRNAAFGSETAGPIRDWDFDGKRIVGHVGYDVYLWDATTGAVLQKFVGHRDYLYSVRFSPDGRYVLSSSGVVQVADYVPECGSREVSPRLWDTRTGKQIWEKDGEIAGAFSPDGQRLLTFTLVRGCIDSPAAITMWTTVSGKRLFVAEGTQSPQNGNRLS